MNVFVEVLFGYFQFVVLIELIFIENGDVGFGGVVFLLVVQMMIFDVEVLFELFMVLMMWICMQWVEICLLKVMNWIFVLFVGWWKVVVFVGIQVEDVLFFVMFVLFVVNIFMFVVGLLFCIFIEYLILVRVWVVLMLNVRKCGIGFGFLLLYFDVYCVVQFLLNVLVVVLLRDGGVGQGGDFELMLSRMYWEFVIGVFDGVLVVVLVGLEMVNDVVIRVRSMLVVRVDWDCEDLV